MEFKEHGVTKGQVEVKQYRYKSKIHAYISRFLGYFSLNLRLIYRDKYASLVDYKLVNNGITKAGFAAMAGLVGNTGSVNPFTYIAVGTSNTAFANTQTALIGEFSTVGLSRASATVSRVNTTETNDTLQLLKLFTLSGSGTVEEVGAFNASSSGDMLGRALTGTLTLAINDELQITYKFKFS